MPTLVQAIARDLQWCDAVNADFRDNAESALAASLAKLPHGAGIDNGIKLDRAASTPDKLVFTLEYHHMNDVCMYDGWTEHVVTVRPAFNGLNIKISGRDRNSIKDYLYDVMDCALREDVALSVNA